MPFDMLKDLLPVASVASNQFFLSVNPTLPVKTLPEFVEYARKEKPPLRLCLGRQRQPASARHRDAQAARRHRAAARAVSRRRAGGTATIAGETQVVLAGASNADLLQAGQLRGLATTGTKRSPMFPDLPTIGDFYPGYDLTIWLGLFAPAGAAGADRDAAADRRAERARPA